VFQCKLQHQYLSFRHTLKWETMSNSCNESVCYTRKTVIRNRCYLLPIRVLNLQLSILLAHQRPIANDQSGWTRLRQDRLTITSCLHLPTDALQLLQKFTTIFCTHLRQQNDAIKFSYGKLTAYSNAILLVIKICYQ